MRGKRSTKPGAVVGRSLLRIVNIAVGCVTLMCAYGGIVDPATWVVPAFAVMAFPIMAAGCVLLALVDLLTDRRQALWMVGTLVLCAGPLSNLIPLNFNHNERVADAPADSTFTLMTYNTFGMVDLSNSPDSVNGIPFHATLDCIVRRHPDIVCMQEGRAIDNPMLRKAYPQLTDSLIAMYPYRSIKDGVVFLSKYRMEEVPTNIPDGESFSTACVRMTVEGNELYVLGVHMQSIGLTDDDKALFRELTKLEASKAELRMAKSQIGGKLAKAFRERSAQVKQVREFVDSINVKNIIVCGDFNDVPGCYAIRTLRADDLRDAYLEGGLGYSITYNKNRLYFRIDHILYRGSLTALSTVRDTNRGSDHYPLITTFEWK